MSSKRPRINPVAICDYWHDKDYLLYCMMQNLANSKTCCEMAQYAYQNGYELKKVIELPDDRLSYTYDNSSWLLMPLFL